MAVQGIGYWTTDENGDGIHVVVTGDDRSAVRTIRDEVVRPLPGARAGDLDWQIDQYTQETIGVTLASEGWEAFSTSEVADVALDGPVRSPVYLVRQ